MIIIWVEVRTAHFSGISSAERSCGNIDSPYQVLSPAVFHGNALFLEEGEGEGRPGMWKY